MKVVVPLLVVVAVVGCDSDGTLRPDATTEDEEVDAQISDSALEDIDARPDAALDAGADAQQGVAGNVKVTVYDVTGAPAASMPVVFLNADSSLVATMTTDAQGSAVASMVAGGSVTAQRPRPAGITGDWIYTYLGVKPGDELVVGDPPVMTPATFETTFLVPTQANAEYYDVDTTCGGGGSVSGATNVIATLSCTTVDVLVRARNADLDTLGVFYVTGVAVTNGGTVDLTAQPWKGYKSITVTIDNVPLDVDNAPTFVFADAIAPFPTETWGASFTFTTMGSVKRGTAMLDVYDIQALDLIYDVVLYRPHPATQQVAVRLAGGQNVTIDIGPTLLPWFVIGPAGDTATNAMKWTQTAGATSDYIRLDVTAIRSDTSRYTWEVAGPPGDGVLALPTLPGTFAAYNFQASYLVNPGRAYLRRVPGGWDSVRECALSPDCFFPAHAQGEYSVASGPDGIVP